ncbi:HRAS-like suppressor 3 [Cynoglossus semilaevis]|uniref:HRAS-like suppressor 3 n=1 Tax=Cynoglossus semilaevis TaxID=244447 RepID=UPI0004963E66|nr:HRAS-like suppressor 3 [Cynoglossus semilaevis]
MARAQYYKEPNLGDLIRIERTCYQHWALYIGGGYVVHLAPPSEVANAGAQSLMSVVADRAVVKKELLKDVVGNSNWRVDNLLDKEYEPRSTCVVIEEAKAWVGRVMRYNVISWNCEHFVTNLRYGKPESRQVRQAANVALASTLAATAIFGIIALAGTLSGPDKEKRHDTE